MTVDLKLIFNPPNLLRIESEIRSIILIDIYDGFHSTRVL